jgi:hypothetical protein
MAKKSVLMGNCSTCKKAGIEEDFMCFCSAYKTYKSIGVRVCPLYLKK